MNNETMNNDQTMQKKGDRFRPGLIRLAVAVWLLAGCTPATVVPTPPPGNTLAPPATLPPTRTPTPMPTVAPSETDQLRRIPAPDGHWTAVVNETAGSLDLQSAKGETLTVFPAGSTFWP